MKFNPGDKVRLIIKDYYGNCGPIKEGDLGTVIIGGDTWLAIRWDNYKYPNNYDRHSSVFHDAVILVDKPATDKRLLFTDKFGALRVIAIPKYGGVDIYWDAIIEENNGKDGLGNQVWLQTEDPRAYKNILSSIFEEKMELLNISDYELL